MSAFPHAVRVQPLPWPIVELLTVSMVKLAHDLRNDFTAFQSMIDLTEQRNQDASVAEKLLRVKHYAGRPIQTLRQAISVLPGMIEQPRTLHALRECLSAVAQAQGVELKWQGPETTEDLAPGLSEEQWCLLALTLVQNALDAHAAGELDAGPGVARSIEVHWQPNELDVQDDGPGCVDLNAAANQRLRRTGRGHMGLGLAVAAALVERHHGTLHIGPGESGGLRARVQLAGA
jgi:signal transduction histidine kinase